MSLKAFDLDPVTAVQLPLSERVLDRLADIMLATDEILDMISTSRHTSAAENAEVERTVRRVYHDVNELMKKMSD